MLYVVKLLGKRLILLEKALVLWDESIALVVKLIGLMDELFILLDDGTNIDMEWLIVVYLIIGWIADCFIIGLLLLLLLMRLSPSL